eukprot:GSA25T00015362001.1
MFARGSFRRAFMPLEEFKRIVRGLGFRQAKQLKEWLRSADCPATVPKCPETVYRRDGWISHLEALGVPRAQHE